MLQHPALLVFTGAILLGVFCRQTKIFNLISVIAPILASLLLLSIGEGQQAWQILGNKILLDFTPENKLIASAFLMVALVANLYCCSCNQKLEVIAGNFYCAFSILCVCAGDFISMFVALELMMIAASALIFLTRRLQSFRAARRYFLTHLFSGSLILLGIIYTNTLTGNWRIISLTELTNIDLHPFHILMLVGCLINVASFPFCGWVINCYPVASGGGMLYLVSFTTKVWIVILAKLFCGLGVLKLCGIAMILYGGLYSCVEDNIRRFYCYLTIAGLGLMVVAIGDGSRQAIIGVFAFLFIHILYKALFGLFIAAITQQRQLSRCSELKMISFARQPILLLALVLSVAMIINLPPFASFTAKLLITNALADRLSYYAALFLSLLSCITLFSTIINFKRAPKTTIKIELGILGKLSILAMLAIILLVNILLTNILPTLYPFATSDNILIEVGDIAKYLGIIVISGALGAKIALPRFNKIAINFDLLGIIGACSTKLYYRWSYQDRPVYKSSFLPRMIPSGRILPYCPQLHNQSTAIYLVVILLIALIVNLNYT